MRSESRRSFQRRRDSWNLAGHAGWPGLSVEPWSWTHRSQRLWNRLLGEVGDGRHRGFGADAKKLAAVCDRFGKTDDGLWCFGLISKGS